MTTQQHTPGPLSVGGIFNPHTNPRVMIYGPTAPGMQSGECIAENVKPEYAAFIIAACNAYAELEQVKALNAELVEALKEAIGELTRLALSIGQLTDEQATDIAIPDDTLIWKLRAILAKVGE